MMRARVMMRIAAVVRATGAGLTGCAAAGAIWLQLGYKHEVGVLRAELKVAEDQISQQRIEATEQGKLLARMSEMLVVAQHQLAMTEQVQAKTQREIAALQQVQTITKQVLARRTAGTVAGSGQDAPQANGGQRDAGSPAMVCCSKEVVPLSHDKPQTAPKAETVAASPTSKILSPFDLIELLPPISIIKALTESMPST